MVRFEFSVTVDLYEAGVDENGEPRVGEIAYITAEEVETGRRWIVGGGTKLSWMAKARSEEVTNWGYWVTYFDTSKYEAQLASLRAKAAAMKADEVGEDWSETYPNYSFGGR